MVDKLSLHCGFDIGGTKILGIAADYANLGSADDFRPLAVRRMLVIEDSSAIVQSILKMVGELESECGQSFSSVGVGIAGIVDREGVLRYSPNIQGVYDFEIRSILQTELGCPVVVENDCTAATWAESQIGAGRGSRYMALVALGTGIGTGFVLDGKLYKGWNGFAGESGHMTVEQTGDKHLTGARGPWEYYVSGPGLRRLAQSAAARGDFGSAIERAGSVDAVQSEHVHSLIVDNDPRAMDLLDDFCRYTAVGVANLVHVLDPETVVIGGGLIDIGEQLVDGIRKWTFHYVLGGEYRPKVKVAAAQLASNAAAVGAGLLAASSV
ncbi:MAG: ROK family protein [Acidimicrobiaceae bacterium]|nr:ROK family protein [Acidimicrobiaceae bacterium]